jgi:hypothetical protein
MLGLQHAKEQEAARLRHELDLVQRTHRYAEMVESLAADAAKVQAQLREHAAALQRLTERVDKKFGVGK